MGEKTIPALFVTANVGSIFEDVSQTILIFFSSLSLNQYPYTLFVI